MRFMCPSCKTPYNVPDDRLPRHGVRTRCKTCGTGLFIDITNGSVREDPLTGQRAKQSPASPPGKFRGDFPTVMSMSKGEKKKKDFVAAAFLILTLSLSVVSGYYALTRLDTRSVTEWLKPFSDFRDNPSVSMVLRRLTGKWASAPDKKKPASSPRLVRRGYELYLKERLDPALETFDRAVEVDPNNPEAHYWKGRTLLKMGKDNLALGAFDKALALKADYWEAIDNIGWLHMRRGEYSESLSFLNRSIELKPDNAWAYYNRGFVHAKMGNPDMALKDAETACRLGYQKGCRMADQHGAWKDTSGSSGDEARR